MLATVSWDQTLVGAVMAVAAAGIAYLAAARSLDRRALRRDQLERRDALEQVLVLLDGPAGDYLRDPDSDYPQREMVELERRCVQAQILFWRDLDMQRALHDMSSPAAHVAAASRLRETAARIDAAWGTGAAKPATHAVNRSGRSPR
jgi:hypothetical protein